MGLSCDSEGRGGAAEGPASESAPSGRAAPGGDGAADAPLIAGRYRLLEQLGTGGMGVVHLAERVADGARVALKLMRPEFASDATLCERLRREARAVRLVRHPSVVALIDDGDAGARGPFVVFELLRGEALADRLATRRRLPVPVALDIIDDVLAGLEAAHAVGVLHRDLKPENVFLVKDRAAGRERAKLLDFGISRLLLDGPGAPLEKLTRAGLVVGTPNYMAPEQALAEGTQDGRVDVYAAGVVLYEMLSGALPHRGANYNQVLAHVLSKDPVPLTDQSMVDPSLAEVVHRAIARRVDERYPTAGAFREALRAWRQSAAARSTRVTEPQGELVAPDVVAADAEISVSPVAVETVAPVSGPARSETRGAGRARGLLAGAAAAGLFLAVLATTAVSSRPGGVRGTGAHGAAARPAPGRGAPGEAAGRAVVAATDAPSSPPVAAPPSPHAAPAPSAASPPPVAAPTPPVAAPTPAVTTGPAAAAAHSSGAASARARVAPASARAATPRSSAAVAPSALRTVREVAQRVGPALFAPRR